MSNGSTDLQSQFCILINNRFCPQVSRYLVLHFFLRLRWSFVLPTFVLLLHRLVIDQLVRVNRKQVRLRVEHPPVQIHLARKSVPLHRMEGNSHLMSVSKEQVEVLEGFPQEERLHHVPRSGVQRVPHIADRCVASRHLGVGLYPLCIMKISLKYIYQSLNSVIFVSWRRCCWPGIFASPSPGRSCCPRSSRGRTSSPLSPASTGSGRRLASHRSPGNIWEGWVLLVKWTKIRSTSLWLIIKTLVAPGS